MAITQGDEYPIPVLLTINGTTITDEMAEGVRIAIGTSVCTYPNGTLTYENGLWYYPLTQAVSYGLKAGKAKFQVQVKMNGKIIGTKTKEVDIDGNIIKGEW